MSIINRQIGKAIDGNEVIKEIDVKAEAQADVGKWYEKLKETYLALDEKYEITKTIQRKKRKRKINRFLSKIAPAWVKLKSDKEDKTIYKALGEFFLHVNGLDDEPLTVLRDYLKDITIEGLREQMPQKTTYGIGIGSRVNMSKLPNSVEPKDVESGMPEKELSLDEIEESKDVQKVERTEKGFKPITRR